MGFTRGVRSVPNTTGLPIHIYHSELEKERVAFNDNHNPKAAKRYTFPSNAARQTVVV